MNAKKLLVGTLLVATLFSGALAASGVSVQQTQLPGSGIGTPPPPPPGGGAGGTIGGGVGCSSGCFNSVRPPSQ
jgi:hypothetical protein